MSKQYIEVTYRDIAKMLCSALPVEGQEFGEVVADTLEAIKRLPAEAKTALKCAYVFSRKVPREEREDLFQELALNVYKVKTSEEKLAYAIARTDWLDWWRKYKIREHYSLDSVTEDEDGNETTMANMIIGECEFEYKMDGKLDAERILDKMPSNVREVVNKRLIGQALLASERQTLSRYVRKYGASLLLA